MKVIKKIGLIIVFLTLLTACQSQEKVKTNGNTGNTDNTDLSNTLVTNRFEGKTLVALGDSITQKNEDTGFSYPEIIAKDTKLNVINMGFGGTAMSIHPQADFDAFSFHSLADAITNQDFNAQEQVIKNGNPEIPDYFSDKLTGLKEIDWHTVEYLTIAFGANDWGKPLDNDEDLYDTNTVKGSARYSIEKLVKEYPQLKIIFIPPIYRFWPDYNNVDSETSTNGLGLYYYEYSEAIVELAHEYHYPYADTYYGLGINEFNRELYFDGIDGTHPNDAGLELLGHKVANTILTEY